MLVLSYYFCYIQNYSVWWDVTTTKLNDSSSIFQERLLSIQNEFNQIGNGLEVKMEQHQNNNQYNQFFLLYKNWKQVWFWFIEIRGYEMRIL